MKMQFQIYGRFLKRFLLPLALLPMGAFAQQQSNGVVEKGLIYQVYVRAFEDGSALDDGQGDFLGLANRLDYLQSIGTTTLLLMPVFQNTGGMGYIPTSFFKPDAHYGSEEDFKTLTRAAHARGIRVLLDAPINHISDSSEWFTGARKLTCLGSNQESGFCNFFYFSEDPCNELPFKNWHKPWNWKKTSCSDVWFQPYLFDATKDRPGKYYATFFGGMPDLKFWNYDSQSFNEPVVTQVKDALKKWLLLGADGFRIDAAKHFIEGEESNAAAAEPRNLELLADLMTSAKQVSPAAEFLGEIWSGHDVIDQYLPSTLSRSLDFPFMESLRESITKEDPSSLKAVLAHFKATQENISPSARVVFFGNHDTSRLASLWGDDLRKQKLATFITFVLPQTPLLLYGEEIGMEGKVKRPDPNDPTDKIEYVHTDRAMPWNALGKFGPDQSRSPGPSVTLPENIETRNLESSLADPESLLNFLKNLMELRMKGSIGAGSKIEALNAIGTVLRVDLAFDDGRYAKAFFNVSSSNSQSLSAEFLGQNSSSQKALSEGLQVLDPQQGDTAGVIAPLGYVLYLTP